jgi:arylsulfatase A-like enzyme
MADPSPPRALGIALRSAVAAGFGIALLDLAITAHRATQPIPLFAWVRALEAAIALYGVAAIGVGLVEGVIAWGIAETLFPLATLRAWLRELRAPDDTRDRAHAAGLVAAALAVGLLAALVFAFDIAVALEMAARRNAALSTAMVAAACVPLCALAWFPLYRVARLLVMPLPRPRALVVLAALLTVAALAVMAAVGSVDWRVIDYGPVEALALFFTLQIGHAWFWYMGRGARLRERIAGRRFFTGGAVGVIVVSLAVTWLRFGDEPRALALLGEESMGAKVLFRFARRLADRDHDGYAGRLGGGDCDDHDPRVHPGAEEIRGDGIDQDCDGVDAPLAARPVVEEKSAAAQKISWKGNLLIITIDTLRADRLSEQLTPRLAAFAGDAVRFTRAYAQAPNTPRSFPSFLTSRFPAEVRWLRLVANFSPIIDAPENTTFFQALHDAGWRTVGEFSHFYMRPENGIARGFDEWDNEGALTLHDSNTDVAAPRIAPRVVAKLQQLKASDKRFVLWTHFFEPHSRYMDHEEYPASSTGLKGLEEKYDGEVQFTDRYVGEILDAVKAAGLADDTAIVIFSDHGEAFGEHRFGGERMFFHGQTLYDELLRVPLLVHVPGIKPRTVEDPVMLVDLGPTIVDLVKAPRPPSFHGRSLLGAMLGEPLAPRPVFAELLPTPSWNHHWRAIIEGGFKLIAKLSENTIELYDLEHDPTEQKNLAGSDGDRAASLQRALSAFLAGEDQDDPR